MAKDTKKNQKVTGRKRHSHTFRQIYREKEIQTDRMADRRR